jgi:hypothetical protein
VYLVSVGRLPLLQGGIGGGEKISQSGTSSNLKPALSQNTSPDNHDDEFINKGLLMSPGELLKIS